MNESIAILVFVISVLSLSIAHPRWWREWARCLEGARRALVDIGCMIGRILSNPVTPEGMAYLNLDRGELACLETGTIAAHLAGATVECLEGGVYFRPPHWRDFDGMPELPDAPQIKVRAFAIFRREGRRHYINSGLLGNDLPALLTAFTGQEFTRDELGYFEQRKAARGNG